jgi:ELWxxDGT repeat protein
MEREMSKLTGMLRAHSAGFETLEQRQLLSANLVADIGGIYPTDSITINDTSYFAASDGKHGKELWKSDGTPQGTMMVKDLTKGVGSTQFWQFYQVGQKLVFLTYDSSQRQASLWTSDGTTAGTWKLAQWQDDVGNGDKPIAGVEGDQLIYAVNTGSNVDHDSAQIWATDGGRPVLLRDLPTEPGAEWFETAEAIPGHVIFSSGLHLWSSDGTVSGTFEISVPGMVPPGAPWTAFVNVAKVGDSVMFLDNYLGTIWKTDGTLVGTQIAAQPSGTGILQKWMPAGDRLYFSVADGNWWTSDGTATGTIELPAQTSSYFAAGVMPDGRLLFVAKSASTYADELWITDGTVAGTKKVSDVGTPGPLGTTPTFVNVDGIVFFDWYNMDRKVRELWRTDGTPQGTVFVQNVGNFFDMLEIDGKLVMESNGQTLVLDPAIMTAPVGPNQATVSLRDGVLRVFGTQDDDSIRLYDMSDNPDRIVVQINGLKRSFGSSSISRIYIYGYSGNDSIAVVEKYGKFTTRSRIWGGGGSDIVYTGGARDTVFGDAGDDSMNGGNNSDQLDGGSGDDFIVAGNGDDTATGDAGSDTVYGNKGDDCIGGGDDQASDHLDGGRGADIIFGKAVIEIFFDGKQGEEPGGLDDLLIM